MGLLGGDGGGLIGGGTSRTDEPTIEELTRQRDVAIKHIAEWCVAIDVNGGGWDDWDDYYKDAMYRQKELPEIRSLLVDAIASARNRRANAFSSQCEECGMAWHVCLCSHDDDDGC